MKVAQFVIQDIETKEYFFEFHASCGWDNLEDSTKFENEEKAIKALNDEYFYNEFDGRVIEIRKLYGL